MNKTEHKNRHPLAQSRALLAGAGLAFSAVLGGAVSAAPAGDGTLVLAFDGSKSWEAQCTSYQEGTRRTSLQGRGKPSRPDAMLILEDITHGHCDLRVPMGEQVEISIKGVDAKNCPFDTVANNSCRATFAGGKARFDFATGPVGERLLSR